MNCNFDSHWQVNLYDAEVAGEEIGRHVDIVIFDTGASQIWIPNPEYN
jgi:hypothetical protein